MGGGDFAHASRASRRHLLTLVVLWLDLRRVGTRGTGLVGTPLRKPSGIYSLRVCYFGHAVGAILFATQSRGLSPRLFRTPRVGAAGAIRLGLAGAVGPFRFSLSVRGSRDGITPLGRAEGGALVSETREQLRRQFTSLIAWERRKHFEGVALISAGLALVLAIVLLPLPAYLSIVGLRWLMPLLLMLLLTPWFLHRWRWRKQDSARALVNLDKTLRLAERATTAWELSTQDTKHAAHELVFKEAHQRLAGFDARRQFPRQWHWQTYAAGPLLLLWIALVWFEVDRSLLNPSTGTTSSLVYKLREFSRDLQAKAKSEGLSQSLKAGQELEKVAHETLAAKHSDEQLKQELAGMAKKFERETKSGDEKSFSAGESREALQDLKAELETARDLF